MKNLLIAIFVWPFFLISPGQNKDADKFYMQGQDKMALGKFEESIKLFTKTIELQPQNYYAWYNRAIAKSMFGQEKEAIPDFNQTIKLAPDYKKGYLNRGTVRKHLTDYEGALSDYSYAIKLDKKYADAYYNRGLVYEMLSKKDSALMDFRQAKENGIDQAQEKIDKYKDTEKSTIKEHSILRLTKLADNDQYGFTSEMPIKVGVGPNGGPENQRSYLNLLRDQQNKPISYERVGSCCHFPSDNAIMGMGLLDKYEITFLNEKGKKKKVIVYFSFYDYEEPMILNGFKTIEK